MSGIAFIVSAPSGAGKTTLCKMAEGRFPDIKNSVSYTTRPSRPGESNGVDYWFVDDATFDRMVERGEFLEYADVYGKRYGTSKKDLEAFLWISKKLGADFEMSGGSIKNALGASALNILDLIGNAGHAAALSGNGEATEDRGVAFKRRPRRQSTAALTLGKPALIRLSQGPRR